jgi:hypothetical protein
MVADVGEVTKLRTAYRELTGLHELGHHGGRPYHALHHQAAHVPGPTADAANTVKRSY